MLGHRCIRLSTWTHAWQLSTTEQLKPGQRCRPAALFLRRGECSHTCQKSAEAGRWSACFARSSSCSTRMCHQAARHVPTLSPYSLSRAALHSKKRQSASEVSVKQRHARRSRQALQLSMQAWHTAHRDLQAAVNACMRSKLIASQQQHLSAAHLGLVLSHKLYSFCSQNMQAPQPMSKGMTTRSPTLQLVTSGPICRRQPGVQLAAELDSLHRAALASCSRKPLACCCSAVGADGEKHRCAAAALLGTSKDASWQQQGSSCGQEGRMDLQQQLGHARQRGTSQAKRF